MQVHASQRNTRVDINSSSTSQRTAEKYKMNLLKARSQERISDHLDRKKSTESGDSYYKAGYYYLLAGEKAHSLGRGPEAIRNTGKKALECFIKAEKREGSDKTLIVMTSVAKFFVKNHGFFDEVGIPEIRDWLIKFLERVPNKQRQDMINRTISAFGLTNADIKEVESKVESWEAEHQKA